MMGGFGAPYRDTTYFLSGFEATWSLFRGGQLWPNLWGPPWVLRSTLKTIDTTSTLVSVDGDNGPMGALTHLLSASPETITER
jgi:hypothetical protein